MKIEDEIQNLIKELEEISQNYGDNIEDKVAEMDPIDKTKFYSFAAYYFANLFWGIYINLLLFSSTEAYGRYPFRSSCLLDCCNIY